MLDEFCYDEVVMLIEKDIRILDVVVALYHRHGYELVLDLFLVLCAFSINVLDQELLACVCFRICIVKIIVPFATDLIFGCRVLLRDNVLC